MPVQPPCANAIRSSNGKRTTWASCFMLLARGNRAALRTAVGGGAEVVAAGAAERRIPLPLADDVRRCRESYWRDAEERYCQRNDPWRRPLADRSFEHRRNHLRVLDIERVP